jgi:hypothetical protein
MQRKSTRVGQTDDARSAPERSRVPSLSTGGGLEEMRQQQALQVAVTTERKNRNHSNFRTLLLLRIRIDAPVFSISRRSYQAALD